MNRILIADDDISVVDTIAGILKNEGGFEVETALRHDEIIGKIECFQPHLLTLDLEFGSQSEAGIAILKEIRSRYNEKRLPIIIISGTGDTVKLRELVKSGMNDYIYKPIDAGDLLEKISGCIQVAPVDTTIWKKQVIGNSKAMMDLMLHVGRLTRAELDTLILGENGTGKDLIAELFHEMGPRHGERFYAIDCTNIPDNLSEIELWGHAANAFTGAVKDKKGRSEMADQGTLLLNEIGDLSLSQQAKILNFIQNKTFLRIGEVEPRSLDIVILVATNKNLYEMVKQGKFREDLYFRLHSNNIIMPPLRDRLEDIPLLAAHFMKKYNKKLKKDIKGIVSDVLEKFQALLWPGNVRQLEKCIETGMINCRGQQIKWKDVQSYIEHGEQALHTSDAGQPEFDPDWTYKKIKDAIKNKADETERHYITHHLEKNKYKIVKTAQAIGLKNYQQLTEIMQRLKISK
ncbi:sigma-54 dependent transcriptional regulator [bacterium]|nr:sigma-54 dependent transcriptional regulator [bacterium]